MVKCLDLLLDTPINSWKTRLPYWILQQINGGLIENIEADKIYHGIFLLLTKILFISFLGGFVITETESNPVQNSSISLPQSPQIYLIY